MGVVSGVGLAGAVSGEFPGAGAVSGVLVLGLVVLGAAVPGFGAAVPGVGLAVLGAVCVEPGVLRPCVPVWVWAGVAPEGDVFLDSVL